MSADPACGVTVYATERRTQLHMSQQPTLQYSVITGLALDTTQRNYINSLCVHLAYLLTSLE